MERSRTIQLVKSIAWELIPFGALNQRGYNWVNCWYTDWLVKAGRLVGNSPPTGYRDVEIGLQEATEGIFLWLNFEIM